MVTVGAQRLEIKYTLADPWKHKSVVMGRLKDEIYSDPFLRPRLLLHYRLNNNHDNRNDTK